MTETTTRVDFPSEGGVTIAAYRWDPDGEPRAIVQLAHGMGEYALRYAPLASGSRPRATSSTRPTTVAMATRRPRPRRTACSVRRGGPIWSTTSGG